MIVSNLYYKALQYSSVQPDLILFSCSHPLQSISSKCPLRDKFDTCRLVGRCLRVSLQSNSRQRYKVSVAQSEDIDSSPSCWTGHSCCSCSPPSSRWRVSPSSAPPSTAFRRSPPATWTPSAPRSSTASPSATWTMLSVPSSVGWAVRPVRQYSGNFLEKVTLMDFVIRTFPEIGRRELSINSRV